MVQNWGIRPHSLGGWLDHLNIKGVKMSKRATTFQKPLRKRQSLPGLKRRDLRILRRKAAKDGAQG